MSTQRRGTGGECGWRDGPTPVGVAATRRIVGYSLADHMRKELVLDALGCARENRRPQPGLLHHSDHGSQYTSGAFQKALEEMGAIPSMGSIGDCFDNAMAESFFATLKSELVYRHSWPTKQSVIDAICEYIERFYNVRRRHSAIGNVSPVDYELAFMVEHQAA